MTQCPECPVSSDLECYCITIENSRLCELAYSRPDYQRLVLARSAGIPFADETDKALAKILSNTCGVRESLCSCTDKPALCHRSGSPIHVTLSQCRQCPNIIPTT